MRSRDIIHRATLRGHGSTPESRERLARALRSGNSDVSAAPSKPKAKRPRKHLAEELRDLDSYKTWAANIKRGWKD